MDYFEYVKADGDVHMFCFYSFSGSFIKKFHLACWCYVIILTAVYSRRREASGFSRLK